MYSRDGNLNIEVGEGKSIMIKEGGKDEVDLLASLADLEAQLATYEDGFGEAVNKAINRKEVYVEGLKGVIPSILGSLHFSAKTKTTWVFFTLHTSFLPPSHNSWENLEKVTMLTAHYAGTGLDSVYQESALGATTVLHLMDSSHFTKLCENNTTILRIFSRVVCSSALFFWCGSIEYASCIYHLPVHPPSV